MDIPRACVLIGLVVGTLLIPHNTPTNYAVDRPIHLSLLVLATIATTCIVYGRYGPSIRQSPRYSSIPLAELGEEYEVQDRPAQQDGSHTPSPRKLRLVFLTLVVALCLRVELFRQRIANINCAGQTHEMLVPLVFAVADYVFARRKLFSPNPHVANGLVEQYLSRPYLRYLLPTSIFALSSMLLQRSIEASRSTYICPASSSMRHLAPFLDYLGTAFDILILFTISIIADSTGNSTSKSGRSRQIAAVGWAFAISTILLLVIGVVNRALCGPEDIPWLNLIPKPFLWKALTLEALVSSTAFCVILSIPLFGSMTTALITAFSTICSVTLSRAWYRSDALCPTSDTVAYVAFCVVLLSVVIFLRSRTMSEHQSEGEPSSSRSSATLRILYGIIMALFIIRTALWLPKMTSIERHPIDDLMQDAIEKHEKYIRSAASSQSLSAAAEEYQMRYKRRPPPRFGVWYEFATSRGAAVIDDFDKIHEDLLPFWSLSPQEIRNRTWILISNPWSDAAGVTIRSGKVAVSDNVVPTHRWMVDGVANMLESFSLFLPDMDLAFNINDEPRISVPFEILEAMRSASADPDAFKGRAIADFSSRRADTWQPIPEESLTQSPFIGVGFRQNFYWYGNNGCPPDSPARTQRQWDVGHLCTACASSHSVGPYLANWTKSADLCHQPDMANSHGFFMSPASFKAAYELYPVFSQSKTIRFNDILYPSAWNYQDKVKYDPNDEHPDPPFEQKNNTLFWRGATSEGVSPGSGVWQGMARQRFIHVANSMNSSNPPQSVLLPDKHNKLAYTQLSTPDLTAHISTDVAIVEGIARCGGRDCTNQAVEFAPMAAPIDFQSHWNYRYLLDLDGAGFSGRFLPFLSSRSLPFKSALFREWYDDRLTPWLHFVPLDIRAHGLWATLLYFAGYEGGGVSVAPHTKEAELIAEKGREWSSKVLRKEDMEIYFFRLLLEWGRLTDDRRDELGFVMDQTP